MTNLEKVQKALELIYELKTDIKDEGIVKTFINNSIAGLEALKKWIKD